MSSESKQVTGRVGGLRRLLVQVFVDFLHVLRLFVQGLAWRTTGASLPYEQQTPKLCVSQDSTCWVTSGCRRGWLEDDPGSSSSAKTRTQSINLSGNTSSPRLGSECACHPTTPGPLKTIMSSTEQTRQRSEITGLLPLSFDLLINGKALAFDLLPQADAKGSF